MKIEDKAFEPGEVWCSKVTFGLKVRIIALHFGEVDDTVVYQLVDAPGGPIFEYTKRKFEELYEPLKTNGRRLYATWAALTGNPRLAWDSLISESQYAWHKLAEKLNQRGTP